MASAQAATARRAATSRMSGPKRASARLRSSAAACASPLKCRSASSAILKPSGARWATAPSTSASSRSDWSSAQWVCTIRSLSECSPSAPDSIEASTQCSPRRSSVQYSRIRTDSVSWPSRLMWRPLRVDDVIAQLGLDPHHDTVEVVVAAITPQDPDVFHLRRADGLDHVAPVPCARSHRADAPIRRGAPA